MSNSQIRTEYIFFCYKWTYFTTIIDSQGTCTNHIFLETKSDVEKSVSIIIQSSITHHFLTANVLITNYKRNSSNLPGPSKINFLQVKEQLKMQNLLQKVKSSTVNEATDFIIKSVNKEFTLQIIKLLKNQESNG